MLLLVVRKSYKPLFFCLSWAVIACWQSIPFSFHLAFVLLFLKYTYVWKGAKMQRDDLQINSTCALYLTRGTQLRICAHVVVNNSYAINWFIDV